MTPLPATMLAYVVAVFWPWGLFQKYGLFPVAGLAAWVLVVVAYVAARPGRRFQTPWELLWPAVLAVAVWAAQSGQVLAQVVLFFALGQYFRGRGTLVAQCAMLSAVSAAAAAAFSVWREFAGAFPTAFSTETPAVLHFAPGLAEGGLVLAFCCALGVAAAGSPALGAGFRLAAAFGALVCLAALIRLLLLSQGAWALPQLPGAMLMDPLEWTARLLLVWLGVRIAAKALVARVTDAPCGQSWFALPPLVLAGCWLVGAPLHFGAPFAALGLCVAYVLPLRDDEASAPPLVWSRAVPAMAVALLGLGLVVSTHLGPKYVTDSQDPRHYYYRALEIMERDEEAAFAYLRRVEELAPRERQTHWLRARFHLSGGRLDQAAAALLRSARGPEPAVLPPPGEDDLRRLTQQLRDAASALPPGRRSLAYERVLFGTGATENGIELLRARPQGMAPPGLGEGQLAAAVAWLVGVPELGSAWRAWDRDLLFGILVDAGAVAETSEDDDLPPDAIVVDVPAYAGAGRGRIVFTALGSQGAFHRDVPGPPHYVIRYTASSTEDGYFP